MEGEEEEEEEKEEEEGWVGAVQSVSFSGVELLFFNAMRFNYFRCFYAKYHCYMRMAFIFKT